MHKIQYRPEIDGLRAIAVLPVILFHAGIDVFDGGFVGVDVFFVISGYLITSIILKEKQEGEFSLLYFYERRARRILPPLFFVLLFCLPFAWIWIPPNQFKDFGLSLVSATTFWSNFLFFSESDYFATISELKPLIHTWSLATEEQFYIVYPILILTFWKYGKKVIFSIIIICSVFSLSLAQWGGNLTYAYPFIDTQLSFFNQTSLFSFYLPTGRIWELGVGALTGLYISSKGHPKKHNQIFSVIGFTLILYSIFAFSERTPSPSFFLIVPTLGTVLVILFAVPNTFICRTLSQKYIVFIGLISFSAYLFHQPLFALVRINNITKLSIELVLVLFLITFVFASFSWKFIEKPFRKVNIISKKLFIILVFFSSSIILLAGGIIYFYDGFPIRFSKTMEKYPKEFFKSENTKKVVMDYLKQNPDNTFSRNTNTKKVLIVGNSHGMDLFSVFNLNSNSFPNYEFIYYIDSDLWETEIGYLQIRYFHHPSKSKITEKFFKSEQFKFADIILVSTHYEGDDIMALYDLNEVTKKFNKVLAVSNNSPEFDTISDPVNDIIIEYKERKLNNEEIEYLLFTRLNQKIIHKNNKIKKVVQELGLIYLDKFKYLCNFREKNCLGITTNNHKIFINPTHYSLEGSKFLGEKINSINWIGEL